MSITTMLPNAMLVNQLSEGTIDGKPDEDARDNCVAASLSAAIHVLTGKTIYGDTLKDAVYGQGTVGMQAPAKYAASHELASLGIEMRPINAGPVGLVAALHTELQAGHPCLITIPSQWGTPVSGQKPGFTTHVVCAVGWGPGWIRCMNPWGGFWHDGDDTYWAQRLCYGQIWTLRSNQPMAWQKQANGTGKDAHGHTCGAGDMAYIEAHGLAGSDGLMSETAYNGPDTFLPLASQRIVTAQLVAGTWTIGENAADVLLNVWQQLQAAKAGDNPPPPPPAPTPLTPYQLAAIAYADSAIAADSALASAAALKGK